MDDKRAAKLDEIATVVVPKFEWNFDGTVGEFAEKWDDKFIYHPLSDGTKAILVTYRSSFSPA